jgi:hypothetical protein
MKKFLLAAALIVGSFTLVGNATPVFAQAGAGGAGGDVSIPRRSVPRVGVDKRDDSMNAGQRRMHRHHRMHKRMMHHKKHKRMHKDM